VLGTVPIEALDVDEDDSLYDVGLVDGAKGFDEGWGFIIVLVDFDVPEDFEARLVGVVHEEQGDAGVVVEVSKTDVLLVAAEIREADKPGIEDTNKPAGSPAMLDVGPAGLADRGHVEAVALLNEFLLRWAEAISLRGTLLHALILAPAAVFLLVFLDETGEG